MRKHALSVMLFAIVIWLATALVRTENERYALSLGMCIDPVLKVADYQCLRKVETRTGWWWHVYSGLTN